MNPAPSMKLEDPFAKYVSCIRNTTEPRCLGIGIDKCLLKRIQVVKLIRLNVELLRDILIEIPDTYVVYQYRDPRGILSSRLPSNKRPSMLVHDFEKEAKILCSNMMFDYNILNKMQPQFKDRIIFMKYEDLAEDAHGESTRVYGLLNESLPQNVVQWLDMATNGVARRDGARFGTVRSNSTKVAYAWRETLTASQIDIATQHCKNVLLRLGYTL